MKLLDWWRRTKREREREAESIDAMRRVDEPDAPIPHEGTSRRRATSQLQPGRTVTTMAAA
jgi:hypothetical protein